MVNEINGYVLSRSWFDFVADNHGKVKPIHSALFFWVCEVWNRLSQPKEFGLPAKEAMHYIGIGRHEAFSSALKDLNEWGFIIIKQASINQYKANIISICPPKNAQGTAHSAAQSKRNSTAKGTAHGNVNIIELKNIEEPYKPLNNTTRHTWANSPFNTFEAFEREFLALGDIKLGDAIHKPETFDMDYYFRTLCTYGENHPQKKYLNWVKERRNWIANNFLTKGEKPILKKVVVRQFEEKFSPTVPVLPKPIAPIQQEIPKSMFEEDEN